VCRSYFSVHVFGVVFDVDGEGFFFAVDLEVIGDTPRVPAGAASAKWHFTFGDYLAGGVGYFDFRIE